MSRTGSGIRQDIADDLSREVYCLLGMPVDAIDMESVVRRIDAAADSGRRLFLSTPNLNFLVNCQSDMEFRETLLMSDLCPPDGMPIIWLGRLLGVPFGERIAGADIFAALKGARSPDRPLKLFLFGGAEGVAAAASEALNAEQGGVRCVGWHYPGFRPVEDLSDDATIGAINASEADFLVAALSSRKGQLWLKRNSGRLRVPVRSHLGAALNFAAGTVKRAPSILGKMGFEWAWRIKEEPYLWRRYWNDGKAFLQLVVSRALPLVRYRLGTRTLAQAPLNFEAAGQDGNTTLKICGAAVEAKVQTVIPAFQNALSGSQRLVVDLSGTGVIDLRFLGLLLVVRKVAKENNVELIVTGASSGLARVFRLNGVEFLLAQEA